jgi:hypothetical protein
MDDSGYRRNFDLDKKNEIHYHRWKEHLKMSIKIAKFGCEMLWTIFQPFFPRVIQIYTKCANFTGLYFLQHFAPKLCSFTHSAAFSSCGVGFHSSCLDQNLVYSWNHPLKEAIFPHAMAKLLKNQSIYIHCRIDPASQR